MLGSPPPALVMIVVACWLLGTGGVMVQRSFAEASSLVRRAAAGLPLPLPCRRMLRAVAVWRLVRAALLLWTDAGCLRHGCSAASESLAPPRSSSQHGSWWDRGTHSPLVRATATGRRRSGCCFALVFVSLSRTLHCCGFIHHSNGTKKKVRHAAVLHLCGRRGSSPRSGDRDGPR